MEYAVEIDKLCKTFGEIKAVDKLDLRIPKGMVYCIIGPNGSGKTTTTKILMGLTRPDSGEARILGEKVPLKENISRIGYMPQETAIYNDLTVHENLEFFASAYSMTKEQFSERESIVLEMTDLANRIDSVTGILSGGMRHRLSLACTLINDPEVIFLDEPTVGVDPDLRARFWTYFNELKSRGKTIVLTTHYMDEAGHCDTIGMMRYGRLIAEGTLSSILADSGCSNLEDAFLLYAKRVTA